MVSQEIQQFPLNQQLYNLVEGFIKVQKSIYFQDLKDKRNNSQSFPSFRGADEQDLLPVFGKPAQIIIFEQASFQASLQIIRA